MKRLGFAICVLLSSSYAVADSCAKFVGNYAAELDCAGLSPHSGVKVQWMEDKSTLTLTYDIPSGHPSGMQVYIADGKEHSGDSVNTGDTYTASCSGDFIEIRRVFSNFKWPIDTELKSIQDGLNYIETFEGRNGATVCRFEPKP